MMNFEVCLVVNVSTIKLAWQKVTYICTRILLGCFSRIGHAKYVMSLFGSLDTLLLTLFFS